MTDTKAHNSRHEELIASLADPEVCARYKALHDGFRVSFLPRLLGGILVFLGNTFFGKEPSYSKFKAIEVIARIPYQSWEVASYMILTFFYMNEKKAIELSRTSRFGREAQDNETMHVVVISQLAKAHKQSNFIWHTLIPLLFSFFYFLSTLLLYLVSPRKAFELNYLFEDHAFSQYSRFLENNKEVLKQRTFQSDFLEYYGRYPRNEYDFFLSVACDEIAHRNRSAIQALEQGK
ncbi:MAG: alternative oxidase [Patescibacteria group bacterium]